MNVVGTIALGTVVVCVITFLYPYVIYPLTLRFFPKKTVDALLDVDTDGRDFALFFCAYNEAKVISEKLENLRRLRVRYPGLAIFAYDDASTDGTREALESEPDLVTVVRGDGRTGKAAGMKRLVSATNAKFLIFTDANVTLDLACIAEFERHYKDVSVGGICGSLRYIASDEATATEATGGLYWRLEERTKTLESATGNVMGADGSIFSVRRELYPDFIDTVQDDFTVSMSVIFSGYRLIKAHSAIAYERLVSRPTDERRRKVRIAARAYHTHENLRGGLGKMAPIDKYKYVSHKVLRWWGAVPLMLGALAAGVLGASFGFAGLGIVAAVTATGVVSWLASVRICLVAADLVSAVLATFVGVMKARQGQTFAVWTPPASR